MDEMTIEELHEFIGVLTARVAELESALSQMQWNDTCYDCDRNREMVPRE